MSRIASLFFAIALLAASPASTFAQGTTLPADTKLANVLRDLYVLEIRSNALALANLTGQPFDRIFEALVATDLPDPLAINQAISTQLSSFPLGSSAGGFSWTFDPTVGTFTRNTATFGPVFAERAVTVGEGRFNLGFSFTRATYDSFESLSLGDREILFYTAFPANLVGEDALSLEVSTNTFGLFGNYGVTDRLDVGFALPILQVDLAADIRFRILNRSGQQQGTFEQFTSGGGSATGFGDLVARAKYHVWQQPGGGVAAGLDLRLPTGDEEDLLGIPGTQAKLYGVYSTAFGPLSPHVNVGYTFSSGNDLAADPTSSLLEPPDELNYTFGADYAVNPRLTVVGDVIGRRLHDIPKLELVTLDIGPSFREYDFQGLGNTNLVLGSAGAKWNAYGNMLLSGTVLFPLRKAGLRDNLTFAFGVDYSF